MDQNFRQFLWKMFEKNQKILLNGFKELGWDIDNLIIENHLAIGNFGGLPSISIPVGVNNNFPYAFNITCKAFDEVNMFNIASSLEEKLGLKNIYAGKKVND